MEYKVYPNMTEDQIERRVERLMDQLDYRLIAENTLTQAEYDEEVSKLRAWGDSQYAAIKNDKPAKRYQVEYETYSDEYKVIDTWVSVGRMQGRYATKAQAQARARTLNSRNGGK